MSKKVITSIDLASKGIVPDVTNEKYILIFKENPLADISDEEGEVWNQLGLKKSQIDFLLDLGFKIDERWPKEKRSIKFVLTGKKQFLYVNMGKCHA